MSGDVPILYLLIVATTAVAGGLTLWERHATTTHRLALLCWATGYFLISAGCLLRVPPLLPHEVTIGVSNVLITWGYGTMLLGFHRFIGRPVSPFLAILLVGATVAWILVGQYQPLGLRVMATSLASGSLCLAGFVLLYRSRRSDERQLRAQRLGALLLAIHSAFFFLRVALTPLDLDEATFWNSIAAITLFEGILWSFAAPATFLAMVRELRENGHREASATDFLTGLDNRRAFFAKGEALLAADRPVALVVFDLDHFKRINDTFGHAVGDEMLMLFSRLAEREMRGVDLLARLGGEEFAALLPDLGPAEAEAVARRVARSLEAASIVRPGLASVRTTVSAGLALWGPSQPSDLRALLSAADRALYRAKREGRNRVERAVPLAA